MNTAMLRHRQRVIAAIDALHVDRTLEVTADKQTELDRAWAAYDAAVLESAPLTREAELERRLRQLEDIMQTAAQR